MTSPHHPDSPPDQVKPGNAVHQDWQEPSDADPDYLPVSEDDRLYTDDFIRENEIASRLMMIGVSLLCLAGIGGVVWFGLSQPDAEPEPPIDQITVPELPPQAPPSETTIPDPLPESTLIPGETPAIEPNRDLSLPPPPSVNFPGSRTEEPANSTSPQNIP